MSDIETKWLDRYVAPQAPFMCLCLTEEEYLHVLRQLKAKTSEPWVMNDQSQASVHYLTDGDGDLTCVVCLRDWQKYSGVEIAGVLVHEAVHIWQEYADNIGERHPGREQEAYAIQHIAQTLMAEFARRVEAA